MGEFLFVVGGVLVLARLLGWLNETSSIAKVDGAEWLTGEEAGVSDDDLDVLNAGSSSLEDSGPSFDHFGGGPGLDC